MSTDASEPKEKIPLPREPELNRLLATALEQIDATQYPNVEKTFIDALKSEDMDVCLGAVNHLHRLTTGIRTALIHDERFHGEKVVHLRNGLGGAMGFYPNLVDQHLVRRAALCGSAEGAVRWLQKVLNSKEATGKLILTLWGVPVQGVIELTDKIKIMPLTALPDSEQTRRLNEAHAHRIPMSALDFAPPSSALVVERRIAPILVDGSANLPTDDAELRESYDLVHEVALVLTLVGPRASLPLITWFTFDDPDFEIGGATSMTFMTEIVPTRVTEYPMLAPEEAVDTVQAYLKLPTGVRRHVRVAIERINQALRRRNVGDRAVEIATAFEALVGDNDKNEMTHKVKVRTVRLIGGSLDERRTNAAIVNKAYAIRSSLVHTGKVDEGATETIVGVRVAVREIVDRALALCVQLTQIIIRRGAVPTWTDFDISDQ
ncbi:hypothetical protein [Burkholderia gladioli]